jgi:hypothetical protein
MQKKYAVCAGFVVACLLLAGCAPEVSRTPTQFISAGPNETRTIVIERDVIVTPESGFRRLIKGGSVWISVGRIPQGSVFKIKDDVFMLVGSNQHEARCVITADNQLVGFYLPVEQAFSPVLKPVALPVVQK